MTDSVVPKLAGSEPLIIDGSYGEGGGQIVRTSLALSAITGRPVRFEKIRAGRRKPGLAAQHLTGVRAAAEICDAQVDGDALGSQSLSFTPGGPTRAGDYNFDVAANRRGGSAGATSLVLQTVLLPLALAEGPSTVEVRGGTHVAWSPPFDYLHEVWLPALEATGVRASLELARWGWYPVGQGEISARIEGLGGRRLAPLELVDRGELSAITGRAAASRLPGHIPGRMAGHALQMLADEALLRTAASEVGMGREALPEAEAIRIAPETVRAACSGAGIFLAARYERGHAGFNAMGRRGKPSEKVAADAASALLDHHDSGAAVDEHLGDQLIAPACLAEGESTFTVSRITAHLTTNAWTVEQFGLAEVTIEETDDGVGVVTVRPTALP